MQAIPETSNHCANQNSSSQRAVVKVHVMKFNTRVDAREKPSRMMASTSGYRPAGSTPASLSMVVPLFQQVAKFWGEEQALKVGNIDTVVQGYLLWCQADPTLGGVEMSANIGSV
jgi:hypothetical protein